MVKYRQNNVGSIAFDGHNGGGHIRLWPAFSGASFRRKFFDTIGCGVSRQRHYDENEGSESSSSSSPSSHSSSENKQKLSEILKHSQTEETEVSDQVEEIELETARRNRRKVEMLEELQGVVKRLGSGLLGDMSAAASDVRRLAKADAEARETLAMLGAIPPLVGMLDSDSDSDAVFPQIATIAALYALLNLAIGNDTNKAAIVKAGAVHKMLKLVDSPNSLPTPISFYSSPVCEAMVANFLGLSALDSNKPIIGSSGAIPFLVKTLYQHLHDHKNSSSQIKQDCLRAIYNLSIFSPNVSIVIIETDLVQYMLDALGDMEVSERILSILSNVASTPHGRKAVSNSPEAFPILVDALNWTDSPGCQEKASYILMVMAHKAYGDRQSMVEAGIVSSLLELTLIGTTLAQRRASRILDCLSVDKGKQLVSDCNENYHLQGGGGLVGGVVSAPIYGECTSSSIIETISNQQDGEEEKEDEEEMMMSEERKAVKQLVQQSLQNNMRRIVKRANLPQDFVPSEHFKSLSATSTSKSLPF